MPTNKLWLEHTERAAWDTIHALREKLSKAERQLKALVPGVTHVPELLEQLDSAKLKYAPDATSYSAVVTELLAHMERLQAQASPNRAPCSAIKIAAPLPRAPLDSSDLPERSRDSDDDDTEALLRFTRIFSRRAERAHSNGPRNIERLLQQAEERLDEMSEGDGIVQREAAVELALLAAEIYAISRAD